jgi:putative holliday junction resolvase
MARIISIDYGLARIGIAISDETKIIARSLNTIKAAKKSKETATKVATEIKQHNVEEIVIGLPYHMNGKIGSQADEVKHFITLLQEELPNIPIKTWDERLTSVQADRSMRQTKMSRKKRAQKIDAVAAVIILQSYLDSKGFSLLPDF